MERALFANPETPDLQLGIPGFRSADLHDTRRLADLTRAFDDFLQEADSALFARYRAHREGSVPLRGPEESALLLETGAQVSRFLGRLFGVEEDLKRLREAAGREAPLFRVKRDFVQRRVLRKGGEEGPDWVFLRLPRPLDFQQLVPLRRPRADRPEILAGHEEHQRRRDGFRLTDPRMSAREVRSEIDYCIYCHEREKDSCAKGFAEKDSPRYRKNPLGTPLTGCPLEERISEMHTAAREGDFLSALALVCIDNPMAPGTGHRICNDCMKACVYQKQDPV